MKDERWSEKSGAWGHQELVHGVAEALGTGFGNALDEVLVELALKHVFTQAAMEICRLVEGGAHLFEQLTEKGLADEIGEGFFQFGCVVGTQAGSAGLGVRGYRKRVRASGSQRAPQPRFPIPESLRNGMNGHGWSRLFDNELAKESAFVFEHFDNVDHVAGGHLQKVESGDKRFELGLAGVAARIEGNSFVHGWIAAHLN